jgi:hypothetical protein
MPALLTALQPADNLVVNAMHRRGEVLVSVFRCTVANDNVTIANGSGSGSVIARARVRMFIAAGYRTSSSRPSFSNDLILI